ncbi:DUF2584 family protein [Aquibacillus rhizosphaerae]|uniref:DUF2584 family protein n=1 Tax=Aquibacillus rhizosphaerae TaxID=3051431 RepID=A0ABT7L1I6_9BACI|nr:DUF2584 family protein [Aquibacillus sp. LR5S19]MDL4839711.1 DUF2584 family protein [Aquibacillus sp. LR5S19]
MSMPLVVDWRLVTHGREKRIENKENMFKITFDGYKLYPINQVIEIRRHDNSDQIGSGKIVELTWKEDTTICIYQLISLYNVN